MEFETYQLKNDRHRDVKFEGVLLGTAEDSPMLSHPMFSGTVGDWKVFELYKTKGGNFIAHRRYLSQLSHREPVYVTTPLKTVDEVLNYFGHEPIAHLLYANAGIENVLFIE